MVRVSADAAVAETHISILFFVADRVYKLKKPVKLSFLDYSDRATREQICHREVELNRRFSPDVYLGVSDVTGPDGEICDHLVVMRRMPPERRLSRLVTEGATGGGVDIDVSGCLDAVAGILARFHAGADRSEEISEQCRPPALRRRWDDNLQATRDAGPGTIDLTRLEDVTRLAHRYVDGRGPLLESRIAAGRVVDGHGDVLADDVYCLDDGPRILDCIEFSDRLRWIDAADDAAFLAMDLESLGSRDRAQAFLGSYRRQSGDDAPPSLVHHYLAYRALVRCKVACVRAGQGGEDSQPARQRAVRLLALCHQHLEAAQVPLVVVGGLPGTGKTTLASAIGERLGWPVLHSDEIRKQQAGLLPTEPVSAGFREGLYGPEKTAATYRELMRRASDHLSGGQPVIVDASWTDPAWRDAAGQTAAAAGSDLVALWCRAPADVTAARITARLAAGGDASDATTEIAEAMAASSPPWPEALVMNTTTATDALVATALDAIGAPATTEPAWR